MPLAPEQKHAAAEAAYRALRPFRLTADQRRKIAEQTTDLLAFVPVDQIANLVDLGQQSGVAFEIRRYVPTTVTTAKRLPAAAAAVVAAAAVLANKEG